MKKLAIIGAALALAIPASAYAAADCCRGKSCCKDGTDCCKNMKNGGEHAGDDLQMAPAK